MIIIKFFKNRKETPVRFNEMVKQMQEIIDKRKAVIIPNLLDKVTYRVK